MKPPTRAPFFACLYHGLCDVARKHGYALAIHGTVTTDLDLIACPWVDDAADPEVLKNALMEHLGACGYAELMRREGYSEELTKQVMERHGRDIDGWTDKPHGRRAVNIYMEFGAKVDLSVMPRKAREAVGGGAE